MDKIQGFKKFHFIDVILAIIFAISPLIGKAEGITKKDTVNIGVYITSLYDVKLDDESFCVDFWLWFHYKNDSLDVLNTTEVINAKEFSFSFPVFEKKNNIIWAQQKCKATIKNPWNIENFPFDKQELKIELEESDADTSTMVYVADVINTNYDSLVRVSGWSIVDFKIKTTNHKYNTTYGDPELKGESVYPMAVITFIVERKGWGLFIKLFTGVYVAFFISLLVFFIDPIDTDPRFGLSVGGLFAAVGNKYIVDSILPESISFTLVDIIHDLTFLYLLLTIALSITSLYIYKNKSQLISKKIDRYSFFTLLISFIILNIYFIAKAKLSQ